MRGATDIDMPSNRRITARFEGQSRLRCGFGALRVLSPSSTFAIFTTITAVGAPLTLKRISRVLLALIGWATPFTCIAQADKSAKIHVVFKSYYERIRPGYAAGITTEEENITLSHRNQVQEAWTSSNAAGTNKDSNTTQRLGEDVWHVVSPHKLSKTTRQQQSVRVETVEFYGTGCKASWVVKLLPGFREYRWYSWVIQEDADYRQARMVSSTCEITSD
jgi:hypothetical protein